MVIIFHDEMIVAAKFLKICQEETQFIFRYTIQKSKVKSSEKIYQKIHIIIIGYLDGSVCLT